MSKYIYFRQYVCMFGWIVLVFDPRMQYCDKMVSLLGRGDGLGHTLKSCLTTCYIKLRVQIHHDIFTEITQPGNFVMNVKQINSQSNLTSMTSFAGPSYLTIRSYVYIILTWDSCLPNLIVYYILAKLHQCALHFNESITRTNLLQLQPSLLGQSQLKKQGSILLWKGPPKLCIECHLVPLWAFPPKSPGNFVTFSHIKMPHFKAFIVDTCITCWYWLKVIRICKMCGTLLLQQSESIWTKTLEWTILS